MHTPTSPNTFPMTNDALLIAMGAYDGYIGVNKFGTNPDVGTSFEHVWGQGGTHVELPAPTTVEIASTDANDTAAGTGARTVVIAGLDENHDRYQETVSLAGQTPVLTTGQFSHIYRLWVNSAGTGLTNAGIVRVADDSTAWASGVPSTTAAIQSVLLAGYGQSQTARYVIPRGYTAYIASGYITAAAGKTVTFRFHMRTDADDGPDRILFEGTVKDASFTKNYFPYARIPAQASIYVTAKVDVGSAVVAAGFDLVCIPHV